MSIQSSGTFHPEAPKRTIDSFQAFPLSQPVQRAVLEEGYLTPTPIQVHAIPHVLKGCDLLGTAQTGTGKTAAFALPILSRLDRSGAAERRAIRALVLTPTRELALQILDAFRSYGHLPHEPETYVHRIGRTARAGASGIAVSFCDVEERARLFAIERLIRERIPVGKRKEATR